MNIKVPQVHATARELATLQGITVNDAVRLTLAAELQRSPNHQCVSARLQALAELQESCRRPPRGDARAGRESELHGSDGLPW